MKMRRPFSVAWTICVGAIIMGCGQGEFDENLEEQTAKLDASTPSLSSPRGTSNSFCAPEFNGRPQLCGQPDWPPEPSRRFEHSGSGCSCDSGHSRPSGAGVGLGCLVMAALLVRRRNGAHG